MTEPVFFGAMLAENLVLCGLLGLDLFAGGTQSPGRALRLGAGFTAVCAVSGGAGWLLGRWGISGSLLIALHAVAAVAIGLAAMIAYVVLDLADAKALGVYLPLAGLNTAALSLMQRADAARSFADALVMGLGAGLGFLVVSMLFSGVRERLQDARPPKAFAGTPLLLLAASLLCLAFAGLSGLRG